MSQPSGAGDGCCTKKDFDQKLCHFLNMSDQCPGPKYLTTFFVQNWLKSSLRQVILFDEVLGGLVQTKNFKARAHRAYYAA